MLRSICREDGCVRDEVHVADPKLCRLEDDETPPWHTVVRRCYTRLAQLRGVASQLVLRCPWSELEGAPVCDDDCRCAGRGTVTVAFMVAHYEATLDYFEADDRLRHPLEHSIEQVVTAHPKAFHDVLRAVQEDYGTISATTASSDRILHRYLARLAERGRILRVDLGDRLYAYLKRGAKAAADPLHCREVLRDAMISTQMAVG